MLPFELLVVVSSAALSHAIKIPIQRRSLNGARPIDVSTLCDWETDPFAFTSLEGMAYTGTIQVGGASFSVQLDTGSSDLWLDTANATLDNLTSTERNASIIYESLTGAAGSVDVGKVTWGDYTFPQAFINAPGANATGEGEIDGVLGLGPPYSSSVRTELETSHHDGSSFVANLFEHYPDVPNFLTFLFGRSSAGETDGGIFTIGEIVPELEAIIDEPALPALTNWAWVTLVDAVVINGARYSGGAFPGSVGRLLGDSHQTAAVLDTGTSTSTAPPQYVDAMYKHLPGARFDSKNRRYNVPCDTKLNVSIVFAGNHIYPMDPLDVITPDRVENGSLLCTGSFEYESNYTGIDFLLGDSFMRNVYSLFEFGSWTKPGAAEPHMKLLSLTDPSVAWAEFDAMNAARNDLFVQWHPENATKTGIVPGLPLNCSTRNSSAELAGNPGGADRPRTPFDTPADDLLVFWLSGATLLAVCAMAFGFLRHRRKRSDGYELLRQEQGPMTGVPGVHSPTLSA